MTKQVKNQILNYLHYQKLFGFSYHKELNLSKKSSCDFSLPNDLLELKNQVSNCHLCDLSKSRKNTLFGYGNQNSKIVFICDEPSKSEDSLGTFFVGNAGDMLANMIEGSLKIKKEEVYTTSLLKCTGQIESNFQNFESCSCYLFKQLDIIKPKIIVAVGERAFNYLLKNIYDFNQYRGKLIPFENAILIPIYQASFLLKNPSLKKDAYHDLLNIKKLYEELD